MLYGNVLEDELLIERFAQPFYIVRISGKWFYTFILPLVVSESTCLPASLPTLGIQSSSLVSSRCRRMSCAVVLVCLLPLISSKERVVGSGQEVDGEASSTGRLLQCCQGRNLQARTPDPRAG